MQQRTFHASGTNGRTCERRSGSKARRAAAGGREGDGRLSPVAHAVSVAIVAGGAAGFAGSASAQLDEIVITAERREMTLQDTPISVIAFAGDTLELKGVRDMFELAEIAPNLDIKGSRGTGNTSPTWQIRGISGGGGATGQRSVGFYVDDVFMPRSTGPVMRVLDVDRIEVLRGPQGTLFGRNSTGGAIRVFSKQPEPDPDGYVRVTGGNFDHYDIAGMINLPLSDNIYLRAQAAYLHQDGFVRRGPQMLGGSEDKVARLQLAFHPSDRLSINLGALHTDSQSDGSATVLVGFNMNPACPFDDTNPYICWEGGYSDWVSDFLEQAGQERLRHDDPRLLLDDFTMPDWCFLNDPNPSWHDMCLQWNEAKYTQLNGRVDWEISDNVSMVSITGLSDFSSDGVSDWQLMGMEYRRDRVESEMLYQEFQFNLTLLDGRVDLVTGLNYFNEDSSSPTDPLLAAIGSSTFNPQAANGNLWACAAYNNFCIDQPPRLRVTGIGFTRQKNDAYGIFASGTVHLTDRLNLTVGLRQSYDEKDLVSTLFASDDFIPQDGVSSTVRGKDDWSELDWRATLDVRVTDDIMVYLTSSTAFRAGTLTTPGASAPTEDRPYHLRPPVAAVPPEQLRNNEIGFRSAWADRRFRLNATYYQMDFTNRQGASAVANPNAPVGFDIQLVNQGDVELWGTEVEAMWAVTSRFTLDAAAGWANYEMETPCVNNGLFIFPPPMDRSFALGGRYVIPAQRGNFTIGVNYRRTGPMETHPGGLTPEQAEFYGCPAGPGGPPVPTWFRDSRYQVSSYDLVNATVRYTSDDGRWMASLYGNNLTDEVYANNAQSFGRGYWTAGGPALGINSVMRGAWAEYRGRPREWGLTFQYNFF
jgi:iron complex outermembrane recepter protein